MASRGRSEGHLAQSGPARRRTMAEAMDAQGRGSDFDDEGPSLAEIRREKRRYEEEQDVASRPDRDAVDRMQVALDDLFSVVEILEGRLTWILCVPGERAVDPSEAYYEESSPLYDRLTKLRWQAQAIAERVRAITDRVEI